MTEIRKERKKNKETRLISLTATGNVLGLTLVFNKVWIKKKTTRHDNNEEHFYGERARKPRLRIVHNAGETIPRPFSN